MIKSQDSSNRLLPISILLFILFFLSYGYFFQAGGGNDNAHYSHVRALAEQDSHEITRYARNTGDIIKIDGKIYSNKPPGLNYLGQFAWLLSDTTLQFFNLDQQSIENLNCYFTVWLTVGLLSALLGVCIFLLLAYQLNSIYQSLVLTIAYQLGTLAFPYSVMFFSHQVTAASSFFAFALIFTARQSQKNALFTSKIGLKIQTFKYHKQVLVFVAGLLSSYSISLEYHAIISTGLILIYTLIALKLDKTLLYFITGFILGLTPLAIFNLTVFDKLLAYTYGVTGEGNNPFEHFYQAGFMGMHWPTLNRLLEITFFPYRGIFFLNPWLILAIPAILITPFAKKYRLEYTISAVIIICYFYFNASLEFWYGGASVGPRYIIASLPFMMLSVASIFHHKLIRYFFYPLSILSIVAMLIVTATNPRPGFLYKNPLFDYSLERFLNAEFTKTTKGIFNQQLITSDSIGFNWSALLGMQDKHQIIFLVLFWIIILYLITNKLKKKNDIFFRYFKLKHLLLMATLPLLVLALLPLY